MKTRKFAIITLAIPMIITALTCIAFSQMQGGPGKGQGGGGMIMGEVDSIDSQGLTVKTPTGETKQVAVTPRTSFVKEVVAGKSALIQGASIFVIGPPTDQNSVAPKLIRIIDKAEEPRGQRGPMMQGGQTQTMPGPVIGTITSVDPLTIQRISGETTIIQVTSETKILQEVSINAAEVVKGTLVRVIAPPTPEGGSSEARKVIVVSEWGPPR